MNRREGRLETTQFFQMTPLGGQTLIFQISIFLFESRRKNTIYYNVGFICAALDSSCVTFVNILLTKVITKILKWGA